MTVITISRQSGSEGNEVARILCEKLGYRQFNKTMMATLIKELESDAPEISEAPDEIDQEETIIERIYNTVKTALESGHVTQPAISLEEGKPMTVGQVRELILAAYKLGNVVIVGRGSQIVLAGKPDVLHVRVVAPLEKRIKNWQAREGLSHKDASRKVKERDKAHIDFVKNFFDTDIRDCELYDVVINTNKLTPAAAADLIIQTLRSINTPSLPG